METLYDDVTNPKHYDMVIPVSDFCYDNKLDFFTSNSIKYLCRANLKGSKKQDLLKAIKYIEMRIEKECNDV